MKSYPKVWFLRHGETEWNAEGRVQGQTESVLSERGRVHAQQQAELMAPILAHNPPCIVSPLKRTRQTADIALGGRDYQTDDRLKEIFAGDWEGHLRADIFKNLPEGITAQSPHMEFYCAAPGGEGFDVFQARVNAFGQHPPAKHQPVQIGFVPGERHVNQADINQCPPGVALINGEQSFP